MKVLSGLMRQAYQRLRLGPRRAPPEYVLALPDQYLERQQKGIARALELRTAGRFHGAERCLRKLARRQPASAAAQALHAMLLLELGANTEAGAAFSRARALAPGLQHELLEAADQAQLEGHNRQALGMLMLAALMFPKDWKTKSRVADVYYNLGRVHSALDWVDAAQRQSGRLSLRLKRLLLELAPIYRSPDHLREVRARYLEGLNELERARPRFDDMVAEVNMTNFYLAYQGMNERDSQAQLARLLLAAAPALGYTAPHCMTPARPRARLRVGIASTFFGRPHSVGIAYNELVLALAARPEFDLSVLCFSDEAAAAMQRLLGSHASALSLPRPALQETRERLAAQELDVLVYADIGMDPFTYYLAFGRYAHVQAVLGGHPITTGVPNLDVYISSELLEVPDGQEHYTERLALLKHLPMGMQAPSLPALRSREELGLPVRGNLYVCALTLQKLHPEFDGALAGILDADPQAEIVLFESLQYESWDREVHARLARTLGERIERVSFLPWQTSEKLLAILACCDVALDSFHFGAGTTAPLTLGVGCPLVTLPPRFQRGRSTLACYLAMGIRDCIASDREDYVRIAVRIAGDPAYRAALRERLLAARMVLFDSAPAAQELGDLVQRLHREAVARERATMS